MLVLSIYLSIYSGTVLKRFMPLEKDKIISVALAVKCNSIKVHNDVYDGDSKKTTEQMEMFKEFWELYKDEPIKGRNLIIKSLCPEVCLYSYTYYCKINLNENLLSYIFSYI